MYGKLFASMYEGSLREHWQALVTLQQLIILADREGVVDMTPQAIAARTGLPPELIAAGLERLAAADPLSRSPELEGRRIVLLDDHRPWGWRLVNYLHYRNLVSERDRREKDAERQRRHRKGTGAVSRKNVTCHAPSAMSRHADAEAEGEAERVKFLSAAPVPGTARSGRRGVLVVLVGEALPKSGVLLEPSALRTVLSNDPPRLRLRTGEDAVLAPEQLALYREAYPGVNVGRELGLMAQWCTVNPSRQKGRTGILRFVGGWLARAHRDLAPRPGAPRPVAEAAYLERMGAAGAHA